MGEINITPLTDVMLVLMIIFMIASPFLHVQEKEGEDFQVPKVDTAIPLGESEHLLKVQADGTLLLNDQPVTMEVLDNSLRQWVDELADANSREGLKLFIAADNAVTWKQLAEVMSVAKLAGVEKIGMVEELIGEAPPVEGTSPAPTE
jgi:biopolymer transport protein TolR